MTNFWLAVASKDHVQTGVQGGFMQVCHGKRAPLARVKAGDGVVYYSPKTSLANGKPCQAFTAIGEVMSETPYQFDMGCGFIPYRKDVNFYDGQTVSIRNLMSQLELTKDKNWGYQLRFGLVKLSRPDFLTILSAMTNQVTLRQATLDDIPALIQLLNLCYRGDPTGQYKGWTDESALVGGIRTTAAELERMIQDASEYLFVYPEVVQGVQTGTLFGSVLVEFGKDIDKAEHKAAGHKVAGPCTSIGMFSVHPSLQAQGAGSVILAAAETFAKRHALSRKSTADRELPDTKTAQNTVYASMYVIAQRAELIGFYTRRGYQPTGKTMAFPNDGKHGEPKQALHLIELKKPL